ncbi:helix-turn-helix domain-containing protein [Helicobacter cetorum]|uniref:Uncharacterized protein n=1 Tax=Helicobacter cetorum (strain ATCC BAA-540 / CCUG 52418 / MIT 99-5656) TaxID=1163745 RepID=I0EUL6_HELCM|nr:helix-turn-helix domain-containing protein [Helicobacter cetorum]AFI06635.1 hypothetical protein HCD_08255 [Helicobacter cetorum MIT 99-5656]
MESRIDELSAKIDALLEQQEKVMVLLESSLKARAWITPQEALLTGFKQHNNILELEANELELAPEISQEDEEKRLCVLKHLGHIDITKNKQEPHFKKDCIEFIQKFNIQKSIIITALYNLKGIKPTKKEIARQLQKLYVWERRYSKGGMDALKDRRGRPLKS